MRYTETLSASEPLRTAQAAELQEYLRVLHEDVSHARDGFSPDFSSVKAYAISTRSLKEHLCHAIGYPIPGSPPQDEPAFTWIGEDTTANYYRTRIPVMSGLYVLGLYIVPKSRQQPSPLVIATHGGDGSPELATFHDDDQNNYHDMVMGAIDRGYVVWAPQLLFLAAGFPDDIRRRFDSRARLIGTTITAIEIVKIQRGLDAVLTRPEVDPKRIAMIGLSYGGFYMLYATALDPRIGVAVSSCFFNDRMAILNNVKPFGFNDWRFSNGTSLLRDPEIVALICPRPLQIQVADKDELFPVDGARSEAPYAARYYQELGYEKSFEFITFEGTHEFFGPAAWQFLENFL